MWALLAFSAAWFLRMCLRWRRRLAESVGRGQAAELERDLLAVRLEFLDRYSNDVFIVLDRDLRIIEANQRAVEMYGRSRDELIGMSARNLRSPETSADIEKDLQNPSKNLIATRHWRKDGSEFPVEVSVSRFRVHGQEFIAGIVRDISRRKKDEEALRESEANFRSLFDNMKEGVALHKLVRDKAGVVVDYRIIDVNSQYLLILGFERDTVANRLGREVYKTKESPFLDVFAKTALTSVPGEFEVYYEPLKRHVHVSVAPWGTDGFATIFTDITSRKRTETALMESERRFRNAMETARPAAVQLDLEARVTFANDSLLKVLGCSVAEVMGVDWYGTFVPPEDRVASRDMFNRVISSGMGGISPDSIPNPNESRIITKSGEIRVIRWSSSFNTHSDGTLVGVSRFGEDITERKRAEAALVSSISLLDATLESTADGILVIDRAGRISKYNRKFSEMWRISDDLLATGLDEPLLDYIVSQLVSPDKFMAKVRELYAHPEESSFDLIELTEGRYFERYSQPQRIGEEIIGRVWSFRDVTGRRKTEDGMKENEERFRRIFEESPVGIAIVGMDWHFIHANPAFQQILGYSNEELSRMTFSDITHPDHRKKDESEVKRLVAGELQRYATNKRYIRKDGSRLWAHLTVSVVRDREGKPLYFIPLVDDITSQHRAEAEMMKMAKLESLGVLAGGIASDFNILLASITGGISQARADKSLPGVVSDRLAAAEAAASRARDLTQQLMAFARGGAPERKPTSLGKVIREAAEFTVHDTAVRCAFAVADGLWAVEADSPQISQVISSLVLNAVHAMPDGGVIEVGGVNEVATVESRPNLSPGRYVKVWVRDSGVGIPGENLGKIFDPYFTTKKKGSGMGLATTYAIIRRHGGTIEAESAPGKGTIFSIYLPALPDNSPA